MGYKKCPRCEINLIADTEDMCEICKQQLAPKATNTNANWPLPESSYIIKNEIVEIDGKPGYAFYSALSGKRLGIVRPIADQRVSTYGECEMRFYPEFEETYHKYHRFKICGSGMKFSDLERYFKEHQDKKIEIDC